MPQIKRKLRVFLCHASVDKSIVSDLYKNLKSKKWVEPWLDIANILPGQHWTTVIKQAIDSADIVIIFISNNSINREGFLQREMNFAWERSLEKPKNTIFLIPLRLEDCDVPYDLQEKQWADYFGEKKAYTYQALLKSLKIRYEQVLVREGIGLLKEETIPEDNISNEEKSVNTKIATDSIEKVVKKIKSPPLNLFKGIFLTIGSGIASVILAVIGVALILISPDLAKYSSLVEVLIILLVYLPLAISGIGIIFVLIKLFIYKNFWTFGELIISITIFIVMLLYNLYLAYYGNAILESIGYL